jgi:stearoyl-CoA desaturase (delta-9 desaturase)
MSFKQPLWLISLGYLSGMFGLILGFTLIYLEYVSMSWLILWVISHVFLSLMVTVGLHRYFAHGSFKTSKTWHNIMAYSSILLLSGSPFGWATAHIAHHIYSDTNKDPHLVGLDYLIWKRYKNVRMPKRRLRHIINDKTLVFVHRYGFPLWMLAVLTILLIGGWKVLLFGYLMPLGSVHFIGAVHQVTSHKNKQPRNLPLLEFILPAAGEWNHKRHHEHANAIDMRNNWWNLDIGYLFIKLIQKK